jgi:hypothetical protein
MKFIQLATGNYTYEKQVEYAKKQFIGHCVYGLDEEGQIWKYVCQNKKWLWAKLEDCNEEYD